MEYFDRRHHESRPYLLYDCSTDHVCPKSSSLVPIIETAEKSPPKPSLNGQCVTRMMLDNENTGRIAPRLRIYIQVDSRAPCSPSPFFVYQSQNEASGGVLFRAT